MTVESFLEKVRSKEPGIRRSVDLWARQTAMPVKSAPKLTGKNASEIAPDGRPYSDGPFKMTKARGNQ